MSDVFLGHALVFDVNYIRDILGLRVSPLGVVPEPKFRIIHGLTFAAAGRTSVNADTDFSCAPECLLGHVLFDILSRILFLRQLPVTASKSCFAGSMSRKPFQILVDPSKAAVFGYVMGDVVMVDLRTQFGWRSSPGFWSLFSSALEPSHTHTTSPTASVLPEGAQAVAHVQVVSPTAPAVSLPRDCQTLTMDGGFAGSVFFVRYYVDDGILVEARFSATAVGAGAPYSRWPPIISGFWVFEGRTIRPLPISPPGWRSWGGFSTPTNSRLPCLPTNSRSWLGCCRQGQRHERAQLFGKFQNSRVF